MAGASDKARFYLEQSVPELHELLRKKLFTEQEISSITRKRSDFEHKINARGSKPIDYARYAEFEMNLDSLRRQRVKRKGLRNSAYLGQRRVFFVLDRATKRFSGDLGLWIQYIEIARKQKAYKKLSQILATALRLHPTNPELWIYNANYALEEKDDMNDARSSMQRGLRFCKHSKRLWCEYAKLEMIFISRILERERTLGLARSTSVDLNTDRVDFDTLAGVKEDVLERLHQSPALSGAIPIAIFNAAMKEFECDAELGEELFNSMASFWRLPCTPSILQHIVQNLQNAAPRNALTLACAFKEPVSCVEMSSVEFPGLLRESLNRLKNSTQTLSDVSSPQHNARSGFLLAYRAVRWIIGLLKSGRPDEDVYEVLLAVLKRTWKRLLVDLELRVIDANSFSDLLEDLRDKAFRGVYVSGAMTALRVWPGNPRILAIQENVA